MPDYHGAIEMLVDEQRVFIDAHPHSAIVIHKTAGGRSAQETAQYFATNGEVTSSHYVIGQDGTVVQCVREKDGAGANCCLKGAYDPYWNQYGGVNLNLVTISIEHVDSALDNSSPVTAAQKQASFALVLDICKRHNISADNIKTHASIDPINRSRCPGNYPMDELIAYVQNNGGDETVTIDLNTPGVGNFFSADGDVWKCNQNGYIIGHAILDFYCSFGNKDLCGLTYLGHPLSNEVAITGGVIQRFERGVVGYGSGDNPPGRSGQCYMAHIESGPGQDPRVAQLETEIAQLKTSANPNMTQAVAALNSIESAASAIVAAVPNIKHDLGQS